MRYLIPLLFLLLPAAGRACSCIYTDNFCKYSANYFEWTQDSTLVARVKFTRFRDAAGQSGYFPLYDFTITEVLAGNGPRAGDRISLLGQDGANCNGGISDPRSGQEFVLFFASRPDSYFSAYGIENVDNPYPIYDLPGCGVSVLPLRNGRVSGAIAQGVRTLSYAEFKEQLHLCLPEKYREPEPDLGPWPFSVGAIVSPNPARDRFVVALSAPAAIYNVSLYDMVGRLITRESLDGEVITEHTLTVAGLPSGVYVLVMHTNGVRVKEQVVVY